ALTLGARIGSDLPNPLHVERYHLFPIFGLTLLVGPLACLVGTRLRLDNSPARLVFTSSLLAILLLGLHAPRFAQVGRFYRFPEQLASLRAIEHLEEVSVDIGLDRERLISLLPIVHPAWFEHPTMLPWILIGPLPKGARKISNMDPADLSAKLSDQERAAIW